MQACSLSISSAAVESVSTALTYAFSFKSAFSNACLIAVKPQLTVLAESAATAYASSSASAFAITKAFAACNIAALQLSNSVDVVSSVFVKAATVNTAFVQSAAQSMAQASNVVPTGSLCSVFAQAKAEASASVSGSGGAASAAFATGLASAGC